MNPLFSADVLLFMNMLSPWHLLLVLLIALLFFGRRLPEVGRSLGRGISEFKKGLKDLQENISTDDGDDSPREAASTGKKSNRRLTPPADQYDDDDIEEAAAEREPVEAGRARVRETPPAE